MEQDHYDPLDPKPVNDDGDMPGDADGMYAAADDALDEFDDAADAAEAASGAAAKVASQAKEKAGAIAGKGKERLGDVASKGRERADQGLGRAASGLSGAAEGLRHRVEERDGTPARAGVKAADAMERAGSYLQDHDSGELFGDVASFVRENPLKSIVAAVFLGWLLGRMSK